MTEAEWLTATNPTPMLEFLRDKASDRKLRLFACGCCRTFWDDISIDTRSTNAVEVSEQYADGLATAKSLTAAGAKAYAAASVRHWACAFTVVRDASLSLMHSAVFKICIEIRMAGADGSVITSLLRDIFGNPFRPVSIDSAWLTSTVLSLARGIYDNRAFDRLPILADTLQDAGCNNDDILNHCRQMGEHVRGCFVVDLILGKS